MEIERKFLVTLPPTSLEEHRADEIHQGYLLPETSLDGVEVRIRQKGNTCFLTIKQGEGLCRTEVEVPLAQTDFDALWPLTVGRRLRKVRHRITRGSLLIELDTYLDALEGLRVAEVEFLSVEASAVFQPPSFFGRELTEDPAYRNANLARRGRPTDRA